MSFRPSSVFVTIILLLHVTSSLFSQQEEAQKAHERQLLRAAEHNDLDQIRKLLAAGTCVNCRQREMNWACGSPLHVAAKEGNTEAVQLLLAAHASTDLQDKDGDTALHYATKKRDLPIVHALLEAGANPNVLNL